MGALVFNTLTGAVSEYAPFDFVSITTKHVASQNGVFALSGDTDDGDLIISKISTAIKQWGTGAKKHPTTSYAYLEGVGGFSFGVTDGRGQRFNYDMATRGDTAHRANLGRGIRSSSLQFHFENTGQDFTLNKLEVLMAQSNNRRW